MFWGLIMEPGRCYTQEVKCAFHVSMAALDISNSSTEPVQVMCVFEGRNYLLCTLNNEDKIQCALDLNFETGTKVSFATNGKAHVHLTGYLVRDEEFLEEEEEDEDFDPIQEKKRLKNQEVEDGPPNKKLKASKNSPVIEEEEEDEDTEDDEDEEVDEEEENSLIVTRDSNDSEDEEDEAEDEEDDDDDQEGDEETSSLSSEEEKPVKIKQNGITKPNTVTPKKKKQETPPVEKSKKQEVKAQKPKKTTIKGGVIVEDLKEGNGAPVKSGKVVHVYYEGRFKSNNKMFDSTTKGPGFSFRVGKGEVIKGWDFGIIGMKAGGKRRIICPPGVAYGAEGSPPVIPPNSTLVFDVEVRKVS